MKYMVLTTKHHEGFCLWDTSHTDYKAPNTPARRDLLRPMVDAFRGKGLKVGFYHSLIDWHHPNFVIDDLHALRDHPDRAKFNVGRAQNRAVIAQGFEIDVGPVGFRGGYDCILSDKTRDIVYMPVGVITGDSVVEPDHPANAEIITDVSLYLQSAHPRIAGLYGAQQALFGG